MEFRFTALLYEGNPQEVEVVHRPTVGDLRHLGSEPSAGREIAHDPVGARQGGKVSAAFVEVVPGPRAKLTFSRRSSSDEEWNLKGHRRRVASHVEPREKASPHLGAS
jgi:hypothetical protein